MFKIVFFGIILFTLLVLTIIFVLPKIGDSRPLSGQVNPKKESKKRFSRSMKFLWRHKRGVGIWILVIVVLVGMALVRGNSANRTPTGPATTTTAMSAEEANALEAYLQALEDAEVSPSTTDSPSTSIAPTTTTVNPDSRTHQGGSVPEHHHFRLEELNDFWRFMRQHARFARDWLPPDFWATVHFAESAALWILIALSARKTFKFFYTKEDGVMQVRIIGFAFAVAAIASLLGWTSIL